MCGIIGVFGDEETSTIGPLIDQMIDKIHHRGPDGRGIFRDVAGRATLAHCRLAIMDPVGGAQPLYNEDEDTVLVGNGEIYNFPQLRQTLAERHQFRTSTDNEAIIHLVEEQGVAAIKRLDGMFAFALYRKDGFLLARDPIGIKPLYYGTGQPGENTQSVYFASELKAFANTGLTVHEFPPGTYYDSRQGFVKYYTVPDTQPVDRPVTQIATAVRQRLEQAVVKRLMSDVPVGAFLSGGLDSSLIAAIMRQHVAELHTFSVGIEGSNDIVAARVVAQHIGSIHHEYLYSAAEVMDHLPKIIYALESFDQDLVRSAIPCYFCSRLAADYVKVILTGEGADELFAGYGYYKRYTDMAQLHRELRRSVTALHNINLQRVDRLTMAHSIEGRVPFLDTDLIAFAQTIAPELKLKVDDTGRRIEKWILRKACEDLLPPAIVWRNKEQFDEGSGTVDLLGPLIEAATASMDVERYTADHQQDQLRSAEECYYHQLLSNVFTEPRLILDNVGRWSMKQS